MLTISIQQADPNSPLLSQVKDLADKNTATLGFLPYEVFIEHARKKNLLIAVDEDGKLAGYLLYRNVKRYQRAIIVHLCITQEYQGHGIVRKLFNELRERTQALNGIGLHCRWDYTQANKVWQALGFIPMQGKRGRGIAETHLTFWWFDHGHRTLFDEINTEKTQVVIDANIFFDFQNNKNPPKESLALVSTWVKDEIEFMVTPELNLEIHRMGVPQIRERHLSQVQMFRSVQDTKGLFQTIYLELKAMYPNRLSENAQSDLKQIAWAIADERVSIFATRDEELLDAASQIYERFRLSIFSPVDLILHIDELFRISEYQHMRLGGTSLNQQRVQKGEHEGLEKFFQDGDKETRTAFLAYVRQFLIDPGLYICRLITDGTGVPLILVAYERSKPDELTIPLFRINKNVTDKKLVRYMLLQFLMTSAKEGRNFTRITDPNLNNIVEESLQEDTFHRVNNYWIKPNLPLARTSQEVGQYFEKALIGRDDIRPYFNMHLTVLEKNDEKSNIEAMVEIERLLWPAKITDAGISTITIPINATWASLWFDEDLAGQTLFGAHQERALNREGVYYSAAKRPQIYLPGRILWYVTKEKRVSGTESIRACSRLDDIVVGKPSILFRQFQHLGIYEWQNVLDTANGDPDREIMAIRFSDTQLFTKPVSYAEWQEITLSKKGTKPPIYSPSIMPVEVFEKVYKLGMQIS